jgi:cobyrinic acid a,c-diamide synthase
MPTSHSSTIPLSALNGIISEGGVFHFPVRGPETIQKKALTAMERAERATLKAEKDAIKAAKKAETAAKKVETAAKKAETAAIKAETAAKKAETAAKKAEMAAFRAEKTFVEMNTLHRVKFISANIISLSPMEEKTVPVRAHTRRLPVRK